MQSYVLQGLGFEVISENILSVVEFTKYMLSNHSLHSFIYFHFEENITLVIWPAPLYKNKWSAETIE